jgi:hypothetical protein
MTKQLTILMLLALLAAVAAGCGSTPEPTAPPSDTPAPVATATTVPPTEPPPTEEPTAAPATDTPEAAQPTATEEAAATEAPTSEPPPAATEAPETKYPPPALQSPPDEVPISWGYSVLLEWSSVGDLAEDEYYRVQLDAYREVNDEPWYGDYVFVKETSFRAEEAFLAPFHPPVAQGQGVVYWWVEVVRKTGEDANGKPLGEPLSQPSEKRTFITEPKPDGG